eukprot:RCo023277
MRPVPSHQVSRQGVTCLHVRCWVAVGLPSTALLMPWLLPPHNGSLYHVFFFMSFFFSLLTFLFCAFSERLVPDAFLCALGCCPSLLVLDFLLCPFRWWFGTVAPLSVCDLCASGVP